ncbi:MAG TPA: O-antigen ligase family protein [Candidatus Hydrogenedentes bacterium]|nr:O-antigen ligase family protein [Candidatus Hydrogenedentota bacterium]
MSDAWERTGRLTAQGYILCLLVLLCPLVYSFRVMSFLHAKEAVLWVGVIGLSALYMRQGVSLGSVAVWLPFWMILGFGMVFHVLLGNARVPSDATVSAAKGFVVVSVGVFAREVFQSPGWRRRVSGCVGLSAVLVAILGICQYLGYLKLLFPQFTENSARMYSVFGNADLLGGYLAMAMPFLAAPFFSSEPSPDRRYEAVWFGMSLFPVILALGLSGSRGAWLAGSAGLLVLVSFRDFSWKRLTLFLVIGGVAMGVAFGLAGGVLRERILEMVQVQGVGVRARLWFWDGAVRMIRDHLIAGVGLGNFAYWSPRYLGEALAAPNGAAHYHNDVHTLYAHSDILQWTAETGLIGLLAIVWFLIRLPYRRTPEMGALAALGVFSLFHFPFHSAPHALLGVLCATGLFAEDTTGAEQSIPVFRVGKALERLFAPAAVFIACFLLWAVFWQSVLLKAADTQYLSKASDTLDAYRRVCAHPWRNALAQRNFAIALIAAGHYAEAEAEIREALDGLDTGQLYLALGALAELRGSTEEAREYLREAVFRIPSNLEVWRRLLRLSSPGELASLKGEARRYLSEEAYRTLETFDSPSP